MKDYPTTPVARLTPRDEAPGARAGRLFAEARAAAYEDVEAFRRLLDILHNHATAICEGGDVYPFGYRETARKAAAEALGWLDQMRVTDSKVRKEG